MLKSSGPKTDPCVTAFRSSTHVVNATSHPCSFEPTSDPCNSKCVILNQPLIHAILNQPRVHVIQNQPRVHVILNLPLIHAILHPPLVHAILNQPRVHVIQNQPHIHDIRIGNVHCFSFIFDMNSGRKSRATNLSDLI